MAEQSIPKFTRWYICLRITILVVWVGRVMLGFLTRELYTCR